MSDCGQAVSGQAVNYSSVNNLEAAGALCTGWQNFRRFGLTTPIWEKLTTKLRLLFLNRADQEIREQP
jgi:hypothetical protein